MILSRLPSATVTDRYGPFTTITDRSQLLPIVHHFTDRSPLLTIGNSGSVTECLRYLGYKRYKHYINIFYKT